MGFRLLFLVIVLEVIFSFIVFSTVLFWVDPTISGLVGQLLFYGSVFFLVSGICVLALLWLRMRSMGSEGPSEKISAGFREGILLGGLVVVMLILQSFRVLVWWVLILLGLLFIFLEGMFIVLSAGKERRKE